ncbi:MAG: hypothetical protein ACKVIW_00895 [bacterium]|jgi:hypothetical protein
MTKKNDATGVDDVLARLEGAFEARIEELVSLAKIPSVSAAERISRNELGIGLLSRL